MKGTEMNKKDEIIGAVARGWCSPKNEKKIMDPDLVGAITEEILKLPCMVNSDE